MAGFHRCINEPQSNRRWLVLQPVLQDIPDLLQQNLRSGGTGGACILMKTQTRQRFDRPEDREANDDEADERVDEQPQVEVGAPACCASAKLA